MIRTKAGAATLSVVSNSVLIALKLAAGAITGSIAILTEAIHSAIDLLASIVALVSVRRADVPPDEDHPYGHEKVESLAATIEGMLILVGAGVIIYEATRRLVTGSEIESLGVGIAVIAFSMVANLAVSTFLSRRAEALDSPALEGDAAHLRADALTSLGVLAGLLLVEITDEPAFDAIAALRARPDRRGAAARGARPDRGNDRGCGHRGDGRLPQAEGSPGGPPPLDRPPRPVPRRNHAGAGSRGRPPASRCDPRRARRGGRAHPRGARELGPGDDRQPASLGGVRSPERRRLAEVDRGRHPDGDQSDRVAGVAVQCQQERRDRADDDGGQP
jgi:hypothetical protein